MVLKVFYREENEAELKEILEGNVNLETTDGTIFEDFNGIKTECL